MFSVWSGVFCGLVQYAKFAISEPNFVGFVSICVLVYCWIAVVLIALLCCFGESWFYGFLGVFTDLA